MGMPLREYYGIQRAAELLECKTEDLLHWASIGAISLYISFEYGCGFVRFFGDGVEKENRDLERFTEEYFEKSLSLKDDFLKKPVISDSESYVFYNEDYGENAPEKSYPCKFNGLWALPHSFFGVGLLYDVHPGLYDFWSSVNKRMFISFEIEGLLSFDASDFYIVKSDFCKIRECPDGAELPNYINGGVIKHTESAGGKGSKPHIKERHAEKREEVLRAAIYIKHNYPDECSNFTNWAEAINDHANLFWKDGELPLSVKNISELLGRAHKLPENS